MLWPLGCASQITLIRVNLELAPVSQLVRQVDVMSVFWPEGRNHYQFPHYLHSRFFFVFDGWLGVWIYVLLGEFVSHGVFLLVGVSFEIICVLTSSRLSKSMFYCSILHLPILESIHIYIFLVLPYLLHSTTWLWTKHAKVSFSIVFF